MAKELTYREYWGVEEGNAQYEEYQQKYVHTIRESDRVLIRMARELLGSLAADGRKPSVLDAGCSTGNLLRHLNAALPGLDLTGEASWRARSPAARRTPAWREFALRCWIS